MGFHTGDYSIKSSIFKISQLGSTYTNLFQFDPALHGSEIKDITQIGNLLFGITKYGGATNYGTIFKYDIINNIFSNIADFSAYIYGNSPTGEVVIKNDTLYGITQYGGKNYGDGTIYKISLDGTGMKVLKYFDYNTSGKNPTGGLTLWGDTIFGTTYYGGTNNMGVIFRIQTNGSNFLKIGEFDGENLGSYPTGVLIRKGDTLFGVCGGGGGNGYGTIFKIKTMGAEFTNIFSFDKLLGSTPRGLTLSGDSLYGTTSTGGEYDKGTVFRINTDGTSLTNLKSFNYESGFQPTSKLIIIDGVLFGVCERGGLYDGGTIFKLRKDGSQFSKVYDLRGKPRVGLSNIQNTLFGVESQGGKTEKGCIFSIQTDGNQFNTLYEVTSENGLAPSSVLNIVHKSNYYELYGVNSSGGSLPESKGTIFKFKLIDIPHIINNGSINRDTSFTIKWLRPSHATNFHLVITQSSTIITDTILSDTTFLISGLDYNTDYNISLKAINTNTQSANALLKFKTKLYQTHPVYPPLSKMSVEPNPILTWKKVPSASLYWLQISTKMDFSTYIINNNMVTDTLYVINSPLNNNNKYYWRVKALNGLDTGAWSASSFTVMISQPTLSIPYDDTKGVAVSPQLSWNKTNYTDLYRVQISNTDNFSYLVLDTLTAAISLRSPVLEYRKQYYWRVKAQNNNMNTSEWSEVRIFTTFHPQTLTFDSIAPRKYGDPKFTPVAVSSADLPVSFSSSDNSVAQIVENYISITGTGTAIIKATQSGNDTTDAAAEITRVLLVEKAPLYITAVNKTCGYGEENPEFTYKFIGFKNFETAAYLDTLPTIHCSATDTSTVGTYPILLTGGSDNNYELIRQNGELLINRAALTVKAEDKTRIYGESAPEYTLIYSGFKNGESAADLNNQPIVDCIATDTSSAGLYDIVPTGASDPNYQIAYQKGKLTVQKALLTIKADDVTRTFGEPNSVFTFEYNGFKNNDNISSLTSLPIVKTSLTENSNVGKYVIKPENASAKNYTFTYETGRFTIEKRLLEITVDNKKRLAGMSNPEFTYTVKGWAKGDSISTFTAKPMITCNAIKTSKAGEYSINAQKASAPNYDIEYKPGILTVEDGPMQLCLVTVDLESGKNLLVWERKKGYKIKQYNVYKQGNETGIYNLLGIVAFHEPGVFVDTLSDDKKEQWYKISITDSSGNESAPGKYHKPHHLYWSKNDKAVHIDWKNYEIEGGEISFKSYLVYRGFTASSPKVIDTIAGNATFIEDKDPIALSFRSYYRIAGVTYSPCRPADLLKANTGPFSHAISNLEDNRLRVDFSEINTIEQPQVFISPNPVKEVLKIEINDLSAGLQLTIEILDITGGLIYKSKILSENNHLVQYMNLKNMGIVNGVYYLKITKNQVSTIKKFIVD